MVTKRSAQPAGFVVLRTPLLAVDEFEPPGSSRSIAALDDPSGLDAALASDRIQERVRLEALLDRPEVQEALYLAAPTLGIGLQYWRTDPTSRRGQRAERALRRYLQRMATRATPFGLFAGCTVGTISNQTQFRLGPHRDYRRYTRLDWQILCDLVDAVEADEDARQALRYWPSTGAQIIGGQLRWVELLSRDERRGYRMQSVPISRAIERLFNAAHTGARRSELVEAAGPDSAAIVERLIRRHALVTDLMPTVTGEDGTRQVIERLRGLADVSAYAGQAADALTEIDRLLADIDASGLGVSPDRYAAIDALMAPLSVRVEPGRVVHAVLVPAAETVTLGQDILQEIERGVAILGRWGSPIRDNIARFREAFVKRYESADSQRAVPLLEALDPELGIGFNDPELALPAPLLGGVDPPANPATPSGRWYPWQTALLNRLVAVLAAGSHELVLDDTDIDHLSHEHAPPLPTAYSVNVAIEAESAEALSRGDGLIHLQSIAGPSGARLLGRFCHADDQLQARVQAYLRAEEVERPDAVFAEIVHLPERRTGNVIHRPLMREYEITYLGRSGAPPDRQIRPDDLVVTVQGERVALWSQRLRCEVIPRLTCAQNYHHPHVTPVYRFLAALQDQGVASRSGLDWGPLAGLPFLPRVRHGRILFSLARWTVTAEEIRSLGKLVDAELFQAAQAWRQARGLPWRVLLTEGDNQLLINFRSISSLETFVRLVQGRDQLVLYEQFPASEASSVEGPTGRFHHELAVPFSPTFKASVESVESGAAVPFGTTLTLSGTRSYPPGSAWLYAKLYAGPSLLDGLLRDLVRPVVDDAFSSGAADSWFFIRYSDPDWHLRLRFHGDPARLHAELLPLLQAQTSLLIETGRVQRLQIDTYDPEIERYGGSAGLALAERVFQVDSEAALEIVEGIEDEALIDARWQLTLLGMDQLLDGLGLTLPEKLSVVAGLREMSAREHHADVRWLRQIGERYRAERQNLARLFEPSGLETDALAVGRAALQRRTVRRAPILSDLRQAERAGRLTMPLAALAPSLLHMHANRLLAARQRLQEAVLYDWLARRYESLAAREQ